MHYDFVGTCRSSVSRFGDPKSEYQRVSDGRFRERGWKPRRQPPTASYRASESVTAGLLTAGQRKEPTMTRVAVPAYKRILVPLDFSDASARALEHAKTLGEGFNASLELFTSYPTRSWGPRPALCRPPAAAGLLKELKRRPSTTGQGVDSKGARAFSGEQCRRGWRSLNRNRGALATRGCRPHCHGYHGRTGMAHLFLGGVADGLSGAPGVRS